MRPGRSFRVSGLIHVILMIQYEKKGAVVMTQTPAIRSIHTPEADRLADIRDVSVNKDLPREERIAEFVRQIRDPYHSNAVDLLSGQVFPREALPWKNASAESYAENY